MSFIRSTRGQKFRRRLIFVRHTCWGRSLIHERRLSVRWGRCVRRGRCRSHRQCRVHRWISTHMSLIRSTRGQKFRRRLIFVQRCGTVRVRYLCHGQQHRRWRRNTRRVQCHVHGRRRRTCWGRSLIHERRLSVRWGRCVRRGRCRLYQGRMVKRRYGPVPEMC